MIRIMKGILFLSQGIGHWRLCDQKLLVETCEQTDQWLVLLSTNHVKHTWMKGPLCPYHLILVTELVNHNIAPSWDKPCNMLYEVKFLLCYDILCQQAERKGHCSPLLVEVRDYCHIVTPIPPVSEQYLQRTRPAGKEQHQNLGQR